MDVYKIPNKSKKKKKQQNIKLISNLSCYKLNFFF